MKLIEVNKNGTSTFLLNDGRKSSLINQVM